MGGIHEDAPTDIGPVAVARVRRQMVYRVGFGRGRSGRRGDFVARCGADGRWDDPDGVWRTLYVADSPLGCYLEVLARFRRDSGLADALMTSATIPTIRPPPRASSRPNGGHADAWPARA